MSLPRGVYYALYQLFGTLIFLRFDSHQLLFTMTRRKGKSLGNSTQQTNKSSEATASGRGLHRPRSKAGQLFGKFKDKLGFSDSHSPSPAPSNIEGQAGPSGVEVEANTQLALQGAQEAEQRMRSLPEPEITVASALQGAQEDLDVLENFEEYLKPLKIFDAVIGEISDAHPYAKIALGVLSCAAKIILAQRDRDDSIRELLRKLGEVYSFTQNEMLGKISSMHPILGKISQQTCECADFVKKYSETTNFWKRLGKNVLSETEDTIKKYNDVFDRLMQNFRDNLTREVTIHVLYTEETLELSSMAYADGAGLDTRKQCLEGTRTEILSQITEWVNSTRDNVPCVLWLSGPAGKGKSAIAHTIAKSFEDMGGLGSCYSFDRQREADRRHEKIFSTIARDLADRDPEMRRALADTVKTASSLKKTADIAQQWQKLLIEPLEKSSRSSGEPVVIVIDALDESG
ncbi:hypothetical protein CY34DRAFT_182822, partial [Suillus luteus UH-Slu-Lm8-n1]